MVLADPGRKANDSHAACFFFIDTATSDIYTLSLHDALPILDLRERVVGAVAAGQSCRAVDLQRRSEEHTSELQSHSDIVCRLLLEKKKHCVTIFVILVVWFFLPMVARLMSHKPTAISIFVCL